MGLIEMLSLNTNISQVKSKHFNSSLFIIPISLEDSKASLQAILDVYFCNSFFIVTMILAFFFVSSKANSSKYQN